MFNKLSRMTLLGALACTAVLLGSGAFGQARADQFDRTVLLVNQSDQPIVQFYATNIDDGGFGYDLLGSDEVLPGWQDRLNLGDGDGYCRFDFLTVMENGVTIERDDVNVCGGVRYTID